MGVADYIKTKLPNWPNWITYPMLKLNVFGPLCYGNAYRHYGRELAKTSPDQLLLDMVRYAIANVPYYRKRYSGETIGTLDDFENKIAIIDKDEVLANWDDFIADSIDRAKCYQETTGGTSGKPMRFLSPNNRYVHSMYFWHRQMKRFGWNYHTVGVIRNHRLQQGRVYMVNPIMKQVIFDAFRTDDTYYHKIWRVMKSKGIKFLYCYPSGAYAFLKSCHRQGLDVSFIKACFLTSEAITENQRYFISEVLGIQILGSYGHSEKLSLAGTVPDDFSYLIEEYYGYTELVDSSDKPIKQTDKEGEIVGTTFTNRFFPLLRYRTGDYASYSSYDKPMGHRCLFPIQGRWDKSLIYRHDGTFTTVTSLNLHGDINEHIDGLQYLQEEKGKLVVLLIKGNGFTQFDMDYLKSHLAQAMGGGEFVEVRFVDKLFYQPNGKFLPLVSKIQ